MKRGNVDWLKLIVWLGVIAFSVGCWTGLVMILTNI